MVAQTGHRVEKTVTHPLYSTELGLLWVLAVWKPLFSNSRRFFVADPAGKLGIGRFGAQNRFEDRERAL
jgi:hypothetical protein